MKSEYEETRDAQNTATRERRRLKRAGFFYRFRMWWHKEILITACWVTGKRPLARQEAIAYLDKMEAQAEISENLKQIAKVDPVIAKYNKGVRMERK